MTQLEMGIISTMQQIWARRHVFFFPLQRPAELQEQLNVNEWISANFEHASFNIMCCVVWKKLIK